MIDGTLDLAIVIVSYNAWADLDRCLASLTEERPDVPAEVVVVDNASSDGSIEAARRHRGVRVIEAGTNLGFAAATNIGIKASRSRHILLLNSDTIVPAGTLAVLIDEIRRAPQIGVVGPRLVDAAGQAELSFGRMLSPLTEFTQRRLVRALDRREPWAVSKVESMTRRRQHPDWVSGACLLVRRDDAEAVGGLDERFFLYTEDVDFCASIRRRGRRVLFTPDVEVTHLRGRSAASAPAASRKAYERSHLAFYEKHHPRLAPLLRLYLGLKP